MKVTPGITDYLEEVIQVEVAHFNPILLKLLAKAIYPALLFHLPRPDNPKHAEVLDHVREQENVQQTSFVSFVQNTKRRKTGRALRFDKIMIKIESEADRVYICCKLTSAIY